MKQTHCESEHCEPERYQSRHCESGHYESGRYQSECCESERCLSGYSESGRYLSGLEMLHQIDGTGGENVIRSLEDIAPDIGRQIIEFAFGDIYTRKTLTLQEREMITITSLLTAGGCEPQLEVHINGSLNVGISPEKIIETFIQCIPYVGFPKVLNAVFTAKKVFAETPTE